MRRNCAGFYYIQFQFYYFLTVSVKVSTVDCCNSFWYSLQGAACFPRPIVIQVWHNYSYMTLIPLSTFLWMSGELLSSLHNIIIHDDIKNICVHVDAQNAQISPQSQSNYCKGIAYYSQASAKIFFCWRGLFIFGHFWTVCFIKFMITLSLLQILDLCSRLTISPVCPAAECGLVKLISTLLSGSLYWSHCSNFP